MKITEVRTYPVTFPVRPEFAIVSSAGGHHVSRYVFVEVCTDEGISGWGEATVVPLWSGETQGGALAVIKEVIAPLLVGKEPVDEAIEPFITAMESALIDNFFTKAAVEMALLDLIGKVRNKPVYEILGIAANPLRIPIKFSIGLREPENAAEIARQKVAEGFTALKMKVGPDPEKDLLRVRLVREAAGPNVKLNVDVNGGWTYPQAIHEIPRYEPFNLEYVEQPVARWDIDGMSKVRANSPLPIMADESVFSTGQAVQVLRLKAADLISIYPGKHGGIFLSRQIAKAAGKAGVACHIGSNLEWDIATAAMCHLAACTPNVQVDKYPVDILGPLYYSQRPRGIQVKFENGHVNVPTGPGLGLDITREEVEALSRQSK